MSLVQEYRATENAIKELQERLAKMQESDGLKKEIEFEQKLRDLMGEYGKGLRDIVSALDPSAASVKTKPLAKTGRAPREVKRFKNPHNGEIVETKGGNHKTLKLWKAEYGADTVNSWLV